MKKLFYILNISIIIVAVSLTLLIAYWLLYPYKVLEVPSGFPKNGVIDKKTYKAGEHINYELYICKSQDINGMLYRELRNDFILTYSPVSATLNKGCRLYRSFSEIPDFAPEGKYRLVADVVYKVNPIREVRYHFESDEFEVIK